MFPQNVFYCLYFYSKRYMLSHINHMYFIWKYYTTLDVHRTCEEVLCKLQGSFERFFFRWFTYIIDFTFFYNSRKPNVHLSHPIDLHLKITWIQPNSYNLILLACLTSPTQTYSPTIWTNEMIFVNERGVQKCKQIYKTRIPPKS